MKGIDIARLCHVSTSTLKHYEEWGLVPEVPRSNNGYREYSNIHAAYFQCIVKMNIGFGMKFVREVMPMLQNGETIQVLWRINEAQTVLQKERRQAEQVVEMLEVEEVEWFERSRKKKAYYTIGEVAEIAGIAPSAIRHWEKEELITPIRHDESGYRLYSPEDVRRVLIIRTVSRAAWSLDIVREVLSETENQHIKRAKEMALQSLKYIDQKLIARMKAFKALTELLDLITNESDIWNEEPRGYMDKLF
ncbi:MerR family DNA-binding transcriptional regulator [Robertmurraya sp. DFI.2.37]|jgi:DNA-binding transcriptional MerR regulator|uniref:MerR family DNA-binding transcriptional regulator n=1 Tax=Robertmurraya sp. DFI.2.37 TaxID=3031819 RepID=UPI001245EC96|nr:MerR family DNA-binding transcriptional regulator [Robertmurraya sp. DFI.2.37]MDF1508954.1 MerR family DNA-binding transcriptional regulator [Robertmurraya sp. DFI.2.37]